MSERIIFDCDSSTLILHPESGIVHHHFKRSASGENFRRVLAQGLELLQDPDVDKWLSDDRANIDLPPEDREWADNWWRPRAAAAGWKYWAVVLPENAFGVVDMAAHIADVRALAIEVRVFSDPARALAWLSSLPVANDDAEPSQDV